MITRLKSFLDKPKGQAVAFVLIVLLAYYYLAKPDNSARDLVVRDGFAYLATGPGGLHILDVSAKGPPVEVSWFDTLGSANGISLNDDYAYIADGRDGLRVVDISDPKSPHEIGEYNTPGYAEDIALSGQFALVADEGGGLLILSVKNPEKPEKQSELAVRGGAIHIAAQGKYAYIADGRHNLQVIDISNSKKPEQIASIDIQAPVNDIYIAGSKAYLAADQRGLLILDISDPADPKETGSFATKVAALGISVANSYAYIADGRGGLVVVDLSFPKELRAVGTYTEPYEANRVEVLEDQVFIADKYAGLRHIQAQVLINPQMVGESSAQGKVEDVAITGKYALLAAGERGLRVLDISDLKAPREIEFYDTPGYAVAVAVKGDLAYVADKNKGILALNLSDLPNALDAVSEFSASQDANDVAASGSYVYLADGKNGFHVIDYQDAQNPKEIGVYSFSGNLTGVEVSGNYAYLSAGEAGLRVVDVSDPAIPTEVGHYDTPGDAQAVAIKPPYVYVADGSRGMSVVDVSNPREPKKAAEFELGGWVQDVSIEGDSAYLANSVLGLSVASIADPHNPVSLGYLQTPGEAHGLAVRLPHVFVADYTHGLRVIDASNPHALSEIGFYDPPGTVKAVAEKDNLAYVVDGGLGLWVIDVSDPKAPREVGFLRTPGQASHLALSGERAYIAGGSGGIQSLDISNSQQPVILDISLTPGRAMGVFVRDNYANVADGEAGLQILEISAAGKLKTVGSYDTTGMARAVVVSGNYAYIADGDKGMRIVNISRPEAPAHDSIFTDSKDARALAVSGKLAYIADGAHGLRIVDVSRPLTPVQIASLPMPAPVTDIILQNVYAFLTDEAGNVYVVDISTPTHPQPVGVYTGEGMALGIVSSEIKPAKDKPGTFRLLVANDNLGLRVLDASKSAAFTPQGLFETPGNLPFRQLAASGLAFINGHHEALSSKALHSFQLLLFDFLVMGFLGLLLWMVLAANFVLPVEKRHERASAFRQLLYYFLNRHGPAVRVKEAQIIQHPGETKRVGPGMALVDLGSALVLERRPRPYSFMPRLVVRLLGLVSRTINRVRWSSYKLVRKVSKRIHRSRRAARRGSISYRVLSWALVGGQVTARILHPKLRWKNEPVVRIEGPGIVFTRHQGFPHAHKYDEIVRSAADLRPQFRLRPDVHAATGDGIDVSAFVTVGFTLGQDAETLLVTYEEAETAENIRVIYRSVRMLSASNAGEQPRRVEAIQSLADEMDPQDKAEIHRYIQKVKQTHATVLELTQGDGQSVTGERTSLLPNLRCLQSIHTLAAAIVNRYALLTSKGIAVSEGSMHKIHTLASQLDLTRQDDLAHYLQTAAAFQRHLVLLDQFSKKVPPASADELAQFIQDVDKLSLEIYRYVQLCQPYTTIDQPIHTTPDGQGAQAPYTFNPRRVFSAVYSQAQEAGDEKFSDWTALPVDAAAEVFRNLLAREKFDDLYMPLDPQKYPLRDLSRRFSTAVRGLGILSFQFVERCDANFLRKGQEWDPSQLAFYPKRDLHGEKILRKSGIKVLFASFSELKPLNDGVRERLVENWRARWQKNADLVRADHDLNAMRIRSNARVQAQKKMIASLSEILESQQYSREAMAIRVYEALEAAAADPMTRQLLPADMIHILNNLSAVLLPEDRRPRGFLGLEPPQDPVDPQDPGGPN